MSTTGVSDSTRQRIILAAEALWDESGRGERLPSVDEVRRKANCDMNAALLVVREWKRLKSAKPEPVAAPVPQPVMAMFTPVLATAWEAAQDLANASLRAAEADWDTERKTLESTSSELASLWQQQDADIEQLRSDLEEHAHQRIEDEQRILELQQITRSLEIQLANQKHATSQAETRAEEIERKASDLKDQLGIAHGDLKALRDELRDSRSSHADALKELETAAAGELEKAHTAHAVTQGRLDQVTEDMNHAQGEALELRNELVRSQASLDAGKVVHEQQREVVTKLQQERDTAVTEAAHLGGKVQALEAQVVRTMELLQRLEEHSSKRKSD